MKRADAGSEPTLPTLLKRDQDRLYDLIRRSSSRKDERSFVVEGPHLLERAFEAVPERVRLVALTPDAAQSDPKLVARIIKHRVRCFTVSSKVAERISDTRSPQGVFAEIAMPSQEGKIENGLNLALDRIQDPGNLGTIIRTAAWFGVKTVALSTGSVDCYNPKVLRSTQGEIFSVGIREGVDLLTECEEVKNRGGRIVAATSSQDAGSLYDIDFSDNITFVFGSEAHGVELSVEQFADETVTIPRFGAGESLNVATSVGIILAEYTKRTAKKRVNSYS